MCSNVFIAVCISLCLAFAGANRVRPGASKIALTEADEQASAPKPEDTASDSSDLEKLVPLSAENSIGHTTAVASGQKCCCYEYVYTQGCESGGYTAFTDASCPFMADGKDVESSKEFAKRHDKYTCLYKRYGKFTITPAMRQGMPITETIGAVCDRVCPTFVKNVDTTKEKYWVPTWPKTLATWPKTSEGKPSGFEKYWRG